ncbi:MAG: HD-GYP domain-containing protein [Clostridia bacterium]|nr:HD-GYP domain-containing protein [Clostridia bacterium]
MKKIIRRVSECEPGIKIAETIYNEYGGIIIGEDTILDDHLIKKLKNLDIEKIKVHSQSDDEIISNDAEVFRTQYNENVQAVKEVLHDISKGNSVDMEKVNTVSESIFVRINENRDILSCINQIRSVDEYTYTHCVNVSLICMLIGKWLKYPQDRIRLLVQAGLLHDIGKGKVPPEILNKPGSLTPGEFEEIKKHAIYGYRMIENVENISKEVATAVLMHHEREDGTGYPMGAKGAQIHEFAKVIAVADIYDAMTSNRVYHEKESPFEVFELMEKNAFGVLDHRIITTFLSNIAAYYIGDLIKLNTNQIGEIIYINPRNVSRPLIKIGEQYLDMSKSGNLKIVELF